MIARCDQCPAVYQPFSHSRFLQVALSFCPETSPPFPLSYLQHDVYMTFARTLPACLPSPLSFSPRALLHPFRFLASALTFISFCPFSTLAATPRSHPRRRHQQTSWLYRESRLDYESWLEAGRLAHWSRREVPFFSLSYRTSLNFALELSRSGTALPCRSYFRNDGEHTNTGSRLVVW